MLEKLYKAEELAERYGCSDVTARRYLRQMRHMENPLRATESAVRAWEASRAVESSIEIQRRLREMKKKKPSRTTA